jgi:HD superfamily phosphohydrolase YqeK
MIKDAVLPTDRCQHWVRVEKGSCRLQLAYLKFYAAGWPHDVALSASNIYVHVVGMEIATCVQPVGTEESG